jgi:hypothetical protein
MGEVMGSSALERLEVLLDEKDERINELETKLQKREYGERWTWMKQSERPEREGLPVPRLEIRWKKLDEWNWLAEYNLVYKHFLGHVITQPLSCTKTSGSAPKHSHVQKNGEIELPFRDGAHIMHDARELNLPAFAISEDSEEHHPTSKIRTEETLRTKGACTLPPLGWWCSREAGHEGPCAARSENR